MAEKFLGTLFCFYKGGLRCHQSHADDILVNRNEPSPVKLILVKDERITSRFFTRGSRVADRSGNVRDESGLFVIGPDVFWAGDALVGEKGCHSRTLDPDLRCLVLVPALRPSD